MAGLSGKDMFDLYQNYGFPPEVTRELAEERGIKIDEDGFREELKKHQEISRTGQEKKFGGHGLILDTGELKASSEEELRIVTRLHTATHLLNAALRKVLGDSVVQNGSDITAERTRFDFNFSRKLTPEELQKVEDLVNAAIEKDLPVTMEALPLDEAKKTGALFMARSKYPDPVKVYTIGDAEETFSKELCGGPHVSRTGEIGRFKILREESSSAGVRRIRATVD
ncbi:MAG: alanine--tRNA ligase-related protein [bacterium]|nr:alanine--tRNA ligase-related protein [bacterium]